MQHRSMIIVIVGLYFRLAVRVRDHGRPANDMHTSRSIFLITYVRRAVHASSAQPHACARRRRRLQCVDRTLGAPPIRPVAVDPRQTHPETHTQQAARPQQRDRSGPGSVRMHARRFQRGTWLSASKCVHVQEHRATSLQSLNCWKGLI